MTTSYTDLIQSAKATYSSEIDGLRFDVTLLLKDVPGNSVYARLYNALNSNLVPLKGTDPSNVDSSLLGTDVAGCWLSEIEAEILDKDKVLIYLHYQHSPVDTVQVRAGSSLSQIETNKDKDGNAISLQYAFPADYKYDESLQGQTVTQGGTVTVLKPERVREYQLREVSDPDTISASYEGKTNSNDTFLGGSPGTWLLASVTGTSDNNNSGTAYWNNTYVFQYREDGWDPEIAFNDPNTGDPPPDLVADTGIKTVSEYEQVDFIAGLPNLGLTA